MTPLSQAAIQFLDVLVGSGATVGILRWFVPYLIRLYFDRKMEHIEKEHRNLLLSAENEDLRKKNADLQIGRLDTVVQTQQDAVKRLTIQLAATEAEVNALRIALRTTDTELASFLSYRPTLDRISSWLDKIDKKPPSGALDGVTISNPKPSPTQFPEQEHIVKGDVTVIRNKPDPKGGK